MKVDAIAAAQMNRPEFAPSRENTHPRDARNSSPHEVMPGLALGKGLENHPVFGGANAQAATPVGPEAQLINSITPASSGKNPFFGGLNGLLDSFNMSPELGKGLSHVKAQFEVNFSSIRAMSGDNSSYYEESSFSFKASIEFMQSSENGPVSGVDETESVDIMDKLKEMFSPEKTAQRILDFALSWYNPKGGDSADARNVFHKEIGAAIQKGFDQAQSFLGELDDDVQADIDKTHELVFKGLDDFLENGLPEDHADRSQSIRQFAASWQSSVTIETRQVRAHSYMSDGSSVEAPEPGEGYEPFEAVA